MQASCEASMREESKIVYAEGLMRIRAPSLVIVVVALVVRHGFLGPMRGFGDFGGGFVGAGFAAVDDPSVA